MNTKQDISIPTYQIPLAVPIGVCSVVLLIIIAYRVYQQTYKIAIEKLREHEVVDLADETRKNADGLQATLSQLREDVLTLSRHPKVQALVDGDITNKSLRADIGKEFENICRAHDSRNATAGVPNWKHYMQVRLIDSKGHERVRVHRPTPDQGGTSESKKWLVDVPLQDLDLDAKIPNQSERKYDKSEKPYFTDTEEIFNAMRDENEPLRVSLSKIQFNQEKDTDSPMHDILTIRASVPLTTFGEDGLEFRGILIINLDLEATVRSLTDAARHLVYLATGEANGSGKPPMLLYNPRFLDIQKPEEPDESEKVEDDRSVPADSGDNPFDIFKSVLEQHVERFEGFDEEFANIFPDDPERAEPSGSSNSVLPLEERGERFPKETLTGKRLRLMPRFQFRLVKLKLDHPTDAVEAQDFREKLTEKLNAHRSNTLRAQRLVRPSSNVISIRGSSHRELMGLVQELENLESHKGRVTREYDEPKLCRHFAAHLYRVYFDPVHPNRYLALFVGFSDEELTADLSNTRSAAYRTFIRATIIGGAVFLLILWWFVTRPIKQLTVASDCIARGEFETNLPTGKRDEIGKLSRAFAVMVNEVQARNTEIRRQNEELDEKVQRRTASLVKARDLLEAAVGSRDTFLATISHELRTPLNHIYGYAQLLEMTDLDEEQRSDLEKLQGSSRHMLRLVQDVLDYQKIIMGRLPVNPGSFDIGQLLATVHESNEAKASQRNNALLLKADGVEGKVYNDKHRLQQILDNLIGNACKFTTDGTITVTAKSDSERIEISVADTGVGISEVGMKKLFQPFSKVADSDLNPDGTGLGLVISQQLARKMGGDVTVSSVPHEGTTFTASVLRDLPPPDSEPQFSIESLTGSAIAEHNAQSQVGKESQRKSSNHVLVIDDDPKVREVIKRLLTEEGLDVMTAASGAEGIELAVRHSPSVITLDLLMPDVDGWTVLAALKGDDRIADIPVVLVTVMDDTKKGYSFGASDYVSKPIDALRLAQVVQRYCGSEAPMVLIIDDNQKDREIVRRMLRHDGCRTNEATDGADGLKKLEEQAPDLIILDLMMPVLDGFTFVEELRRKRGTDVPPIIALTAKEMTAEDRDRLNGMVSDVIQKGQFDNGRFLQEIHKSLDNIRMKS